jgi:hypothetical protein
VRVVNAEKVVDKVERVARAPRLYAGHCRSSKTYSPRSRCQASL